MVIRAAMESDYPAVARIQALSPEAAQWPLGDYSNFKVVLAVVNGAVAGFCAWRQTAVDEAELLNVAVDPGMRKQGVASSLLEELRRRADGCIFLEVAEANIAARALYRRTGWEQVSTRKDYYGPGRNAIVMKKSSC
jgi:ribosomal-protein-alanine N-acetyltransferase